VRAVHPLDNAGPAAAIYLSQPGTGEILGARQYGEFGDDPRTVREDENLSRLWYVEVLHERRLRVL
jgi:hypothetical protein